MQLVRRVSSLFQSDEGLDAKQRLLRRPDFSINNPDYLHVEEGSFVNSNVVMHSPLTKAATSTGIYLKRQSSIGRRCEINIGVGDRLTIGEFATMNQHCMINGKVTLGNYSILAPSVFITSGTHLSKTKPSWLIRDQDLEFQEKDNPKLRIQKPVYIGEDAWIGYSAYIHVGVYIGRGAQIGPNSVVLRDVPPYSMQFGNPAREFEKRLVFEPRALINAADENHWPYFYEGFYVKQEDMKNSLPSGVLFARPRVSLIFPKGDWTTVRVSGRRMASVPLLRLRGSCYGVSLGEELTEKEDFTFEYSLKGVPPALEGVPLVMQKYLQVDFDFTANESNRIPFGISSAEVF